LLPAEGTAYSTEAILSVFGTPGKTFPVNIVSAILLIALDYSTATEKVKPRFFLVWQTLIPIYRGVSFLSVPLSLFPPAEPTVLERDKTRKPSEKKDGFRVFT